MEVFVDQVLNSSPYSAWLVFAAVPALTYMLQQANPDKKKEQLAQVTKTYHASCHCKAVSFEVIAPKHLVVWDCNCSICYMKKNWHFIVPYANLKLAEGSEDFLTEYKFNTKTAKHKFCKQCGVQAFYIPRSNPDGAAITLACVPVDELVSYEVKQYDGQNWEQFYKQADISKFSKA